MINDLANYKKNIKRIPKGARTLAAYNLSNEINNMRF